MKVRINGYDYDVQWNVRSVRPKRGKRKFRLLASTTCTISLGDEIVADAEVSQNYKDPCNLFVGERESLTEALKQTNFIKKERKQFWNNFLEC